MKPLIAIGTLLLTVLAWAQAGKERRAGPSRNLPPRQTVIFTDGKYALVDNKSKFDFFKDKKAEASCPAGLKAMSAGFSAASGRGEPADYRLILSKPANNGDGWVIYARYDGKGDALASDFPWELAIHLVCMKPPA